MTEEPPQDVVAVSPDDQSSDRVQSDSDHSITVGKLDELKTSSDNLSLAIVEYQERARLAARRFRITLGALIAVLALILAGFLALLAPSKGARDAILDCVQPTGHCFKDGQARTAEVLRLVDEADQHAAAAAAACAPSYVHLPLPQAYLAILACVERRTAH